MGISDKRQTTQDRGVPCLNFRLGQTPEGDAVAITQKAVGGNTFPVTLIVTLLWLLVVVAGMAMISHYVNSPGRAKATPIHWPVDSRIPFDASRPILVMFVHPHCPCTRASLGELDRLAANCQGRFNAQVWVTKSAGTAVDWTNTDLWHQAAAIPGVTVRCDDDGVEARRFHAETSGQTVLYDQDGHLLFQGGITVSRGHSGDNPGRSALEALLKHKLANQIQTPVFGCSLFETQCQQGGTICKQ